MKRMRLNLRVVNELKREAKLQDADVAPRRSRRGGSENLVIMLEKEKQ